MAATTSIRLTRARFTACLPVIAGCAAIGVVVFCSYAIVFSMDTARRFYTRTRRALDGCLAVVFGVAGIRLLAWSSR